MKSLLWLYELSTLWLGVLVLGAFLAGSLGGLWLTRTWARKHCNAYNDLVNYYIATVSVFYAVLVGLIAVASWGSYTDIETEVGNEAVSVANLYRNLEGYPVPLRVDLREKLRRYVHHVIQEEWPDQRRGIVPTMHGPLVAQIVYRLATFEPATAGQQAIHAETLRQMNEFLTHRRLRLQAVDSGLPGLMWLVVLMGAVVIIGMTYFLWNDNLRVQSFLTAALALTLGLVIFLILSLDRPLWGRAGVDPGDFQEVLKTVMGEAG